ncbi:hypothetical protein [Bradyrhizobium sp. USDA 4353]
MPRTICLPFMEIQAATYCAIRHLIGYNPISGFVNLMPQVNMILTVSADEM